MPKVTEPTQQLVNCYNCKETQPDNGQQATCHRCGFQPLPSYAYPRDCCFHPTYYQRKNPKPKKPSYTLAELVAERRAARAGR